MDSQNFNTRNQPGYTPVQNAYQPNPYQNGGYNGYQDNSYIPAPQTVP